MATAATVNNINVTMATAIITAESEICTTGEH